MKRAKDAALRGEEINVEVLARKGRGKEEGNIRIKREGRKEKELIDVEYRNLLREERKRIKEKFRRK